MITLYHHGSSVCAAKVRLVLAEKSVPWNGIYVDILRGDQFDPGYVKGRHPYRTNLIPRRNATSPIRTAAL
jgi:glutathione S-transferase